MDTRRAPINPGPLTISITENKSDFLHPTEVPHWVQALTEQRSKEASVQGKINLGNTSHEYKSHGYRHFGHRYYTYGDHGVRFTSDDVTLFALPEKNHRVLDIGTGNGEFIRTINKNSNGRILATGISIEDLRPVEEKFDPNYKVLNAENLFERKEIHENEFDGAFSHLTFMHFADPAKALMGMYKAVKPGGFLVIDTIQFFGLQDYHKDLIPYLQSTGYKISAFHNRSTLGQRPEKLSCLVIIKNKPTLDLPIQYDIELQKGNIDRATYSPSQILRDYRSTKSVEFKETNIDDIDTELLQLLNNPDYAAMDTDQQSKAIIRIVSKISPEQRRDHFRLLMRLNQKNPHNLWNNYADACNNHSPHKLRNFTNWSNDPETALVQLTCLALAEIAAQDEINQFRSFCHDELHFMPNTPEKSALPCYKILPPALRGIIGIEPDEYLQLSEITIPSSLQGPSTAPASVLFPAGPFLAGPVQKRNYWCPIL